LRVTLFGAKRATIADPRRGGAYLWLAFDGLERLGGERINLG